MSPFQSPRVLRQMARTICVGGDVVTRADVDDHLDLTDEDDDFFLGQARTFW